MTFVIVTVSNRRTHLLNQHCALSHGETSADGYIVVAMNEPDASAWLPRNASVAHIVNVNSATERLPLAAAHNLGAHR